MKNLFVYFFLLLVASSCYKGNYVDDHYIYFNEEEENLLSFTLNDTLSFIDNNETEYFFKVTKDSLYHEETDFNLLPGTYFSQYNNIKISALNTVSALNTDYDFYIIIKAEKTSYIEYEIYTYKEYNNYFIDAICFFNSEYQNFEIIDTTINNIAYKDLYVLRENNVGDNHLNTKTLVLMNKEQGIVLIEKTDENSNILFRLRKI